MSIEELLDKIKDYSSNDKNLIIRAYEFASVVHDGVKRKSGEDYIIHPLSVACILADMHADADTIASGLLHDVIEDGFDITDKKLATIFNPTIAKLVDGVTKMKKLQFNNDKKKTDEANMRKIVQSITYDVRIFIIKLADRLHNMRTLEFHKPEKQIENAIETMELFVPFAFLIGEYTIMLELQDLSFKYLDPLKYYELEELEKNLLISNRHNLDEVICTISQYLNSNNIPFNIKFKMKNIYGLNKRLKQYPNISDIHDLFEIKIILHDEETCYLVRDQIENMFETIDIKRKDYIEIPKTNMYRSLHSTVISPNGQVIQFQIKTLDMYKINAYGVTAYWNMVKHQKDFDPAKKMQDDVEKFQFFEILNEMVNEVKENDLFNEEVRNCILCRKIYVTDQFNRVIELPINSTVSDMAFMCLKDNANNLIGAYINNEEVKLDTILHNKDKVELIIDKEFIGPRVNYVDYCNTNTAIRRIKKYQ